MPLARGVPPPQVPAHPNRIVAQGFSILNTSNSPELGYTLAHSLHPRPYAVDFKFIRRFRSSLAYFA
jgi:hypothetical protein